MSPGSKGEADYARQIDLEHAVKEDPEEDGVYRDDTREERAVSRRDSAFSDDFPSSHVDAPFDLDSERPSGEPEEADEETSDLMRLPRDAYGDFSRYTEQNGGANLYDDYETKDVAKRGASSPKDYEEIEEDPGVSAAELETRMDARVKRDQAEISETLDPSESSPDDPAKLQGSTKILNSREVSRVELPKGSNEAPDDASSGIRGSRNAISKLNDPSEIRADEGTSSKKDGLNAEYERRVEEEIQRRIDSLKEEIQRDVQVQQRVRDIEDNNARFDELRDREHEDEGRRDLEDEPIEKRQTVAKRSVRELADDTAAGSSETNEEKRSPRREQQHKKRQHRSNRIEKAGPKSDASKENENLKRQLVINHDKSSEQLPTGDLKKKRERVRQVFLVNNDPQRAKKRQSRRYTLPSNPAAVRPENELFLNPDSDNRMVSLNKKRIKIITRLKLLCD